MLAGGLDQEINEIIYRGRLIALKKKNGWLLPIAIGYTLRRLAAKCANKYATANSRHTLLRFKLESARQGEQKQQSTQ